ncbi:MAG TPA: DedA family protein [Firmicutes bacterium]|nr:DedA family protein [Bacillota bacterium]
MALESANIPIPSEAILPLAGYLVWKGHLTFWEAVLAGLAGGMTGSLASYWLGRLAGRPALERYGRLFFVSGRELAAADRWFARYGPSAVLFGRLVPGIRTFISLPAGVARMPLGQFFLYSLVGSAPWTALLTWAGMVAGEQWTRVESRLHTGTYMVLGILVLLAVVLYVRHRHSQARTRARSQS